MEALLFLVGYLAVGYAASFLATFAWSAVSPSYRAWLQARAARGLTEQTVTRLLSRPDLRPDARAAIMAAVQRSTVVWFVWPAYILATPWIHRWTWAPVEEQATRELADSAK